MDQLNCIIENIIKLDEGQHLEQISRLLKKIGKGCYELNLKHSKILLKKIKTRENVLKLAKCRRTFSVLQFYPQFKNDEEVIVYDLISNFRYYIYANINKITKEVLLKIANKGSGLDLLSYSRFFNDKELLNDKDLIRASLIHKPSFLNVYKLENDKQSIKILLNITPELVLNWLNDEEMVLYALKIRPSLYLTFPQEYRQRKKYFFAALKSTNVLDCLERRSINKKEFVEEMSKYHGYNYLKTIVPKFYELKFVKSIFINSCKNEMNFNDMDHLCNMIDIYGEEILKEILSVNFTFPCAKLLIERYIETIHLQLFFNANDLSDDLFIKIYPRINKKNLKSFYKKLDGNISLIKKLVTKDRKIVKHLHKYDISVTSGYFFDLLRDDFSDILIK